MAAKISSSVIIAVEDLKQLAKTSVNLIIVDASNEQNAKQRFKEQHLENAIFIDLNEDLAAIPDDASAGGRHPLPSVQNFTAMLGYKGITEESHLVIYDYKNGANAAARFWWMMKAVGHEKVQVLNGGFQAAAQQKFPLSNQSSNRQHTNYNSPKNWILPTVAITQVTEATKSKQHLIIDVREAYRYRGEKEPIDLIAGHIPQAVNVPYIENLDENGLFKQAHQLKELYQKVLEGYDINQVIVHCGSGVTACHTLLTMAYAGFTIPNLYVGSWSEWSRNNKPIVTGQCTE